MKIPKRMREQLKVYEREGFHATSIEMRAGSHRMVTFAEFPEPQILSDSKSDWRRERNNVAVFRKLAAAHKERTEK